MSYLEYRVQTVPTGWRKILALNWPLVLMLVATASVGFLMLYSVAGGSFYPYSLPQMQRFGLSLAIMFVVAMIPIWFWRNVSVLAYVGTLGLLVLVELIGVTGTWHQIKMVGAHPLWHCCGQNAAPCNLFGKD